MSSVVWKDSVIGRGDLSGMPIRCLSRWKRQLFPPKRKSRTGEQDRERPLRRLGAQTPATQHATARKPVNVTSILERLKRASECQADTSLNITWRPDGGGNHASGRAAYTRIRKIELRMIECIEELAADLQTIPLPHWYFLEDRRVEIRSVRPPQNVAPAVAIRILQW